MGLKHLLGIKHPTQKSREEEARERERREVARRLRTLQLELEVIKRARS